MGIRETFNRHEKVVITFGAGVIATALLLIVGQLLRDRPHVVPSTVQLFYSDDDGRTWFVDDASKAPPFDHNGNQAVRAEVFRCRDGVPFVGCLLRYSDAAKAMIARTAAADPNSGTVQRYDGLMESKKPGETTWAATGSLSTAPCPDGSTDVPIAVSPSDSNNGAVN